MSEQETSQTIDKCSYSDCNFSKDSDNFLNILTWRLLLLGSPPWWEKAQDITKFSIAFSAVTWHSCCHTAGIPESLSKRRWRASSQVPWAPITSCSRNPVTLEQSLLFKPVQLWERYILQSEMPLSKMYFNYRKERETVCKKDVSQHSSADIYRTASAACSKEKRLTMSHLVWQHEKWITSLSMALR